MKEQKKKYKIALVLPSLMAGGMERVMSELANYFITKANTEVHLILYGKQPEIFYEIDSKIIIHKPEQTFNNQQRLISTIKRMLFLRKKIKNIKPHTVLSFGTLWNRFVLLSLLGTGYPVYISDRGNPNKKQSFFQEMLAKILYPTAAGIIAQTHIAENVYLRKRRNSNIAIIGNPININYQENNDIIRENIIITVGRLILTKHHDRLINIFSKLNAPDWQLIIVGDDAGKEYNMSKLQLIINNLGLKEKVILAGKQKNVTDYYKKAKIFAFTSSSEGFPNVIGEAMAAGLPVVSYDCEAGPSEMVKDGENGFLIPLFQDSLFQEKLKLLTENEKMREEMGFTAKESIKKFSISKIGLEYFNFILPDKSKFS